MQETHQKKDKELSLSLLFVLLLAVLCIAFTAVDIYVFYFFFEASLVPTLVLILGWGYQPERIQAGVYMMMYTLWASLPLLGGLIVLSYLYGSGKLVMMHILRAGLFVEYRCPSLLMVIFFFAFLVKLPCFPVHLWLPKAHVEAPVGGSMALAAILLKLGGYGGLRVYQYLGVGHNYSHVIFMCVALWGGMLARVVCFRQVDMKALIAYSSVGHIRFVLCGMFSDSVWG